MEHIWIYREDRQTCPLFECWRAYKIPKHKYWQIAEWQVNPPRHQLSWTCHKSIQDQILLWGTIHILRKHSRVFSFIPTTFSQIFSTIFLLIYVVKFLNYSMKISSKCNVEKEIILFLSGSCHLDRALNNEFSVECTLWFFQPTWKSDLKLVQITKNYLFWVNAPL